MSKFAIIGAGFIFDRHVQAIKENKGEIVSVCDIDEKKKYKADMAKFYTDWEVMLDETDADYVVICTPNYLHAKMCLKAHEMGFKVICEKPPVVTQDEYKALKDLEDISIVLQCRYSKPLIHLNERMLFHNKETLMEIEVHRDDWYMKSWKADPEKSGGLLYNIGCHYFDLLCWWFGKAHDCAINKLEDKRIEGWIKFKDSFTNFTIAIDAPVDQQKRILEVGAERMNLTQLGFESLHPEVYKSILKGDGYKLKDFNKAQTLIESLYASRDGKR